MSREHYLTQICLIANHDVIGFYCLKNRVAVYKNILFNVYVNFYNISLMQKAWRWGNGHTLLVRI